MRVGLLSPFLLQSYYIASVIPSTIACFGLQAAGGREQDAHSTSKDVFAFSKFPPLLYLSFLTLYLC